MVSARVGTGVDGWGRGTPKASRSASRVRKRDGSPDGGATPFHPRKVSTSDLVRA